MENKSSLHNEMKLNFVCMVVEMCTILNASTYSNTQNGWLIECLISIIETNWIDCKWATFFVVEVNSITQ